MSMSFNTMFFIHGINRQREGGNEPAIACELHIDSCIPNHLSDPVLSKTLTGCLNCEGERSLSKLERMKND